MIIIARLRDLYGTGLKNKKQKKTNTKYFLIYEKNVYFFRQRNCFVDI